MCKWKIKKCDSPVSYCTEGLNKYDSLEIEYYFTVPEGDATPILEVVCNAVANGFKIEDGVMVRDLFNNVPVFFFKTKSLASDADVFRLVLPDWELEFPWEIYGGITQKAHFKRQIKFKTDKVFCLVVSGENIQDEGLLNEFTRQDDLYVLPVLYYVLEYDTRYFNCNTRRTKYKCNGPKEVIYVDALEELIFNAIAEKILGLKVNKYVLSDEESAELNSLNAQLVKLKVKEDNAVNALLEDSITDNSVSSLNKTMDMISKKKKELSDRIEKLKTNCIKYEDLSPLKRKWRESTYEVKKKVANLLIEKIVVSADGGFEVIWKV